MSNDVLDLFKNQGASDIGLDDDTAEAVVANLNANTLPMCIGGTDLSTIDTDDIILIMFALDASPSMEDVEDDVIREFNKTILPALKGASEKTRQAVLVGGMAFNERVWPLWNGFLALDQVPELTRKEYSARGSGTALHQAMLDALSVSSVFSSRVIDETNTPPKVIVVVLTDGANNCQPVDPAKVKEIASKLSKEIFVLAFAGFSTYEGVDYDEIADETGFSAKFEVKMKPGESEADKQKRFRHLIGTLSSSLVRQSQTQITPAASASFWAADPA